ncbi:hypothetical protein [Parasitella parasitica]|uniref:Integrase zinc-binding domain-containing protein n=1 Tax=Parasitella parasitica TaxID=35722 RepID=A0A0B7NIZ9_9FUNG|nr:hypothetical protein [Parasitella parasitica]
MRKTAYILDQLFSTLYVGGVKPTLDYELEVRLLVSWLVSGQKPSLSKEEVCKLSFKAKNYMLGSDWRFYRRVSSVKDKRFVKVPFIAERPGILAEVHDGHGHFGVHSTWSILYRNYWWPNVFEQMKAFLKTCHPGIFKQFAIDYVGPLPLSKSGCKYALVCIEMFTRWPLAVANKKADAVTAATFLHKEVFTRSLPSDQSLF